MRHISSITLGVVLSALVARDAAAQWNVARFGSERNRVYTTFGLDPALVTSVGYGRVVPLFNHDFQLTGDAGVVTARLDTRDFRARLGTQTSVVRWRSLHLAGSATFIARGTENSIYRAFNFGADLTGTAGLYRQRWFAAGEFGKDKAIITHLTNSEWYRTHFYPDAKDGWYLDAGGTYHYGVVSGIALGNAELVGRAGWLRTERFNDMMPPLYATVGLGFGF
ncbi:MAG TPA: hypothetical protein VL383_03870 [Gemmatimonadaceae bacterium]|jgi:hypothetical protein|nr:hypothetical protein [Gemmatimonadaceae bacterium]